MPIPGVQDPTYSELTKGALDLARVSNIPLGDLEKAHIAVGQGIVLDYLKDRNPDKEYDERYKRALGVAQPLRDEAGKIIGTRIGIEDESHENRDKQPLISTYLHELSHHFQNMGKAGRRNVPTVQAEGLPVVFREATAESMARIPKFNQGGLTSFLVA